MTTLEAIALGAMVAWTPSLVVLAVSLWDVPELEPIEDTIHRRVSGPG
jgi:hypothetical protein